MTCTTALTTWTFTPDEASLCGSYLPLLDQLASAIDDAVAAWSTPIPSTLNEDGDPPSEYPQITGALAVAQASVHGYRAGLSSPDVPVSAFVPPQAGNDRLWNAMVHALQYGAGSVPVADRPEMRLRTFLIARAWHLFVAVSTQAALCRTGPL